MFICNYLVILQIKYICSDSKLVKTICFIGASVLADIFRWILRVVLSRQISAADHCSFHQDGNSASTYVNIEVTKFFVL
jgi:hypothetical protein